VQLTDGPSGAVSPDRPSEAWHRRR